MTEPTSPPPFDSEPIDLFGRPQTNRYDIGRFARALYRDLTRGWITVNHDSTTFDTEWVEHDQFDEIVERVVRAQRTARTGVWLPIATRKQRLASGRGTRGDCLDVVAFVVDIDIAGPHHARTDLVASVEEAL